MTGSLVVLQNVPGALRQLITMTSEKYHLDFVLLDMSPSTVSYTHLKTVINPRITINNYFSFFHLIPFCQSKFFYVIGTLQRCV